MLSAWWNVLHVLQSCVVGTSLESGVDLNPISHNYYYTMQPVWSHPLPHLTAPISIETRNEGNWRGSSQGAQI